VKQASVWGFSILVPRQKRKEKKSIQKQRNEKKERNEKDYAVWCDNINAPTGLNVARDAQAIK